MKIVYNGSNCVFMIDDEQNCHCFSYTSEVAAIVDGKYIEYDGPRFYGQTSNRHKAMFRAQFGL